MQLSVIVPCYNAAATLAVQLEALGQQRWQAAWEIIVVDNGSTDDTAAVVQRYRRRLPQLRLVAATARRGAAYARNVGAKASKAECLAFCDADDQVAPGWLAAIAEALQTADFVASRFEHRRLNAAGVLAYRRPHQVDGLIDHPFFPHAGGCGLGIKRRLHQQVGGFDESIRYLEDTDYCWRLQLAGVALQFVPKAVVHIRYRPTVAASFAQAQQWGECSVLLYRRFRPSGYPVFTACDGGREWVALGRQLWQVRSRGQLGKWCRNLGWRLGRLRGAVKYRVFAL